MYVKIYLVWIIHLSFYKLPHLITLFYYFIDLHAIIFQNEGCHMHISYSSYQLGISQILESLDLLLVLRFLTCQQIHLQKESLNDPWPLRCDQPDLTLHVRCQVHYKWYPKNFSNKQQYALMLLGRGFRTDLTSWT